VTVQSSAEERKSGIDEEIPGIEPIGMALAFINN
jgi:hypothetical protein